MCNQFTFYHQFRIDTGRTNFDQQTDSIISAYGSYGQTTHKDPDMIDLNAPRLAWYKQKTWKKHQNAVYWVDINLALKKGLKFYQTRSNAIILHTPSLLYPESCSDGNWRSHIRESICVTSASSKDLLETRLERELGSEVAGSSKDTQRIEPKTQLSRTGRPVSEQPTGSFTQLEEIDIDFRVSGLPHAVVKQAENFRVLELVKNIESHPHREALQANLHQNNVYNPFSNNSKAMIREMGNVELFELCETIPKVQCSQCLLYWNQGVIYCTCGHSLVESESRKKFHKLRLDALSIPHYAIKKGRSHGGRHGKTEEQKEYHITYNAWKRCCKKVDSQGDHFTGIHDRFLRDPVYRESQLAIGRTEQKCIKMDKLAKENHTYRLSKEEFQRYQGQKYLTLNKSGKNSPMRLRSDFRAAVSNKNRLHRESGEERAQPISPQQYRRWHPSSSSDSWWNWDTSKIWWSS